MVYGQVSFDGLATVNVEFLVLSQVIGVGVKRAFLQSVDYLKPVHEEQLMYFRE